MKPLLDLPWRSCKWPVAEQDGKHLFCGKPLPLGTSEDCFYCAAHEKMSLNPTFRARDLQASADTLTRGERVPRRPDSDRLRDLVEEIGEE